MIATIGGEQVPLGGDIILSVEGIQMARAANLAKIRDQLASQAAGQSVQGHGAPGGTGARADRAGCHDGPSR